MILDDSSNKYQQMFKPEFVKPTPVQLTPIKNAFDGVAASYQFQQPAATPLLSQIAKDEGYCPNIRILNKPFTHLKKHPINTVIGLMNAFCHHITQASKVVMYQTSYGSGFKQGPSTDQLLGLARVFGIDVPRNQVQNHNFFRVRSFVLSAKEEMLKRLFNAINLSNGLPALSTSKVGRNYSSFKIFVGSGNNAQLVTQQMFKDLRWWWQVQTAVFEKKTPEKPPEEFDESEEADEGKLLQ